MHPAGAFRFYNARGSAIASTANIVALTIAPQPAIVQSGTSTHLQQELSVLQSRLHRLRVQSQQRIVARRRFLTQPGELHSSRPQCPDRWNWSRNVLPEHQLSTMEARFHISRSTIPVPLLVRREPPNQEPNDNHTCCRRADSAMPRVTISSESYFISLVRGSGFRVASMASFPALKISRRRL